jgi:hypothetical protein
MRCQNLWLYATDFCEPSENCGSAAGLGDHRAAQLRSHKVFGYGRSEIQDGFIQRCPERFSASVRDFLSIVLTVARFGAILRAVKNQRYATPVAPWQALTSPSPE